MKDGQPQLELVKQWNFSTPEFQSQVSPWLRRVGEPRWSLIPKPDTPPRIKNWSESADFCLSLITQAKQILLICNNHHACWDVRWERRPHRNASRQTHHGFLITCLWFPLHTFLWMPRSSESWHPSRRHWEHFYTPFVFVFQTFCQAPYHSLFKM